MHVNCVAISATIKMASKLHLFNTRIRLDEVTRLLYVMDNDRT